MCAASQLTVAVRRAARLITPARLHDLVRLRERVPCTVPPVRDGPIHECIANWHACIAGTHSGGWPALLHPDCVFFSPVVFTPQRGRDLTMLYLSAASDALAGAAPDTAASGLTVGESSSFRYVKQICDGRQAMLEFETTVDGKYVDGVDIISCDEQGLVIEIKVMIRPLQAINAVHAEMKSALEQFAG
jgi:hypothetical protein